MRMIDPLKLFVLPLFTGTLAGMPIWQLSNRYEAGVVFGIFVAVVVWVIGIDEYLETDDPEE